MDEKPTDHFDGALSGCSIVALVFVLGGFLGCNIEMALFANKYWADLGSPIRSFFMFGMISTGLLAVFMWLVSKRLGRGK